MLFAGNKRFLIPDSMAWVPYTTGDALPQNAIIMLKNGRRLYSGFSWHSPTTWVAGMYAEDVTAAHYPYSTRNIAARFDIVVYV